MRRAILKHRFPLALGLALAASATLATTGLSEHASKSDAAPHAARSPAVQAPAADAKTRTTSASKANTSATCTWVPRNGSFGGPGWQCASN